MSYAENIRTTGFELEYQVAQAFSTRGWNVIGSKYYVDDLNEAVREIDLVAYSTGRIDDTLVYTIVIISCKKNDDHAWAFLSKELHLEDPNVNWRPLHGWSNVDILRHMLFERDNAANQYFSALEAGGSDYLSQYPDRDIFAFQEMKLANHKPQNDRQIFESITSLMKAQAYELGALPSRRWEPVVYQFNLLTVVAADLVRLNFSADGITEEPIRNEHYVARYIVNKVQTFARIDICHSETLEDKITELETLHSAQVIAVGDLADRFYDGIIQDRKRLDVLKANFFDALYMELHHLLDDADYASFVDGSWLTHGANPDTLEIHLNVGMDVVQELRLTEEAKEGTAMWLQRIYRYEGSFELEDVFPF